MKVLTDEQAATLSAFFESFDMRTTGVWRLVAEGMTDDFGIEDPEAALAEAREALDG